MSDHALYSPSGRHRWRRCPGSVRMTKDLEETSGKAADDGTLTHWVLEQSILTASRPANLQSFIHPTLGAFVCDTDRAERVNFCLDYICKRAQEIAAEYGSFVLQSEEKLDSSAAFGRNDLGGTLDVSIQGGIFLEIIDLKDGMNPVSAEENDQLVLYAIEKILEIYNRTGVVIERVRLTILQPKLRFSGGTGIDSWDTTGNWLAAQIPIIIKEVQAAEDPNAPMIPGDIQCRYCGAKGFCTAFNNNRLGTMGIQFDSITDLTKTVADAGDTQVMDNDRIKELILAAPMIRKMLEAVEEEALNRFRSGNPINGLKVIKGRGSRSWIDPEKVEKKLSNMGVPKARLFEKKLISIAKLEKLSWANKKGETVSLDKRQLETINKEYVNKSDGSPKVVSIDTEGDAIELSPARLFGPVNPEAADWLN